MLMRDIYFYNTNLYTGTLLDQFAAAIILGILSDKCHLCNLHTCMFAVFRWNINWIESKACPKIKFYKRNLYKGWDWCLGPFMHIKHVISMYQGLCSMDDQHKKIKILWTLNSSSCRLALSIRRFLPCQYQVTHPNGCKAIITKKNFIALR